MKESWQFRNTHVLDSVKTDDPVYVHEKVNKFILFASVGTTRGQGIIRVFVVLVVVAVAAVVVVATFF